ncbi:MAG: xanthine dehydrogenase family protein molybdopterin-binding subunit [Deltaproteobacteria bacterium]|nr:xanthine dehydrogenase family protein molybdopterin-binding subunit [Deltaproteobacteria bacterium]
MSSIGENASRVDGPAKVTGAAQYTGDLEFPGLVHVKALRSVHPHGRLVSVDASAAEALPGVVAVLTRADLSPGNSHFGPVVKDQPIVAVDRVRYAGEVVAAVAAEEPDIAEEALDLIQVEYEPLEPVLDPIGAMSPGAPVLHESRVQSESRLDKGHYHYEDRGNVLTSYSVGRGDVDEGFASSDLVFEDTYTTPKIQHGHLEPHVVAAAWDAAGKLTVHSATQNPSSIRVQLAELFELPQSMVRVVVPYVGGGYGGKVHLRLEPLAAALARKARRPVQWKLTREEVFLTGHCHAAVVRIKTGVKRDGTILARQVEAVYDTGAYALTGPSTSRNGGEVSGGPYRIPHQRLTSYCVYTNTPPTGPYRGFGVPQVCWAYEAQMDDMARRLELDPLEMRLRNLVYDGDVFVTGDTLEAVGLEDCLRAAAGAVEWRGGAEQAPRAAGPLVRGKGLAVMVKTTMTPSHSSAGLRLNADGSATLLSGSVDIGQGVQTTLAQMVSEVLGLPRERVSVTLPDTDVTPFDQSTSSSRTVFSMGNAAVAAARQVADQLLEIGAGELEADPADLELRDGHVQVAGVPDRRLAFGDLFRARFGGAVGSLFGNAGFQSRGGVDPATGKGKGKASAFFFLSACAAEVEVDTETGKVRVVRLATAVDAGKAINPRQCHLQNEGSMLMSLGSSLFEEMVFDNGQPINCTFLSYLPPSMQDHPETFTSLLVEHPHPDGPFGAKGMGEAALGPVEPAIGNAVANALGGARVKDLPLRPERVLEVVRGDG